MDASTASWILVGLGAFTALGSIGTQIYFYGRIVERVNNATLDILNLQNEVRKQGIAIAHIEGSKNSAARAHAGG